MDEKEYEHRLTAVESRCKSNSHRLDTVEAELKENTELIVSIKELALETKHMFRQKRTVQPSLPK